MEEGKLSLESRDIAEEKRQELLRLFPEVQTEGGKIDFDQLKRALGETVDAGRERYGMNWPGKADCFRLIQSPSTATLLPVREESVRFDETENMIIEGDNLEVLKLLQKGYQNKVKMIYIDPPYNTGNDFIYPDDFADNLKNYLQYTGQADSDGKRFSNNLESDGRFHSNWLNMIYPRLYLARNLMREDGVILISISDSELPNLRKVCGDIFGEINLIACMVWEKSRKNDAKLVSVGHEYLLIYARSLQRLKDLKVVWREEKPGAREIWVEYLRLREEHGANDSLIERDIQSWFQKLPKDNPSKKWARYKRVDRNGPWRDRDISWPGGEGPRYDVPHPLTGIACKVPERGWIYSTYEEMKHQIDLGLVEFRKDHTEPPFRKAHIRPIPDELELSVDEDVESESQPEEEEMATQVRGSYFYKQSQVAVKYLRKLLGTKAFDNPKDHEEIKRLIKYVVGDGENEIILDFFGGSGTTGEATLELNREDGTNHRFILVQLPELCNPKERSGKAAIAAGWKTVADITRNRLRRTIEQQQRVNNPKQGNLLNPQQGRPEGFRAFTLAPSNFKVWEAHTDEGVEGVERQMELAVNHIMPDRTAEDLFYEILMKSEYPLTAKVETFDATGIAAYSVEDDALIVCVERKVTAEAVAAIAKRKPSKVIFLDEAFSGNDQLKANAKMNFESAGVKRFETV